MMHCKSQLIEIGNNDDKTVDIRNNVKKGESEEDWYCAYLSTVNNGVPIGCAHSILGVSGQVSPYEAITNGFRLL